MGLHSEKYAKTVYDQVLHDSGQAGFGDSSIAIFGKPETGKFEFVLTGRHCTRRCDGDSVDGTAFGGPIFMAMQLKDLQKSLTILVMHIGTKLKKLMKSFKC